MSQDPNTRTHNGEVLLHYCLMLEVNNFFHPNIHPRLIAYKEGCHELSGLKECVSDVVDVLLGEDCCRSARWMSMIFSSLES